MGDPERRAEGTADGNVLRAELPEGDVQPGDGQEGEGRGDRVRHGVARGRAEEGQMRLDQAGKGRLADPAEGQRGQRHAELRGRQIAVEPLDDAAGHPGPRRSFRGQLGELGRADLDHGEFGGDEEAVRDDEEERQQDVPGGHTQRRRPAGAPQLGAGFMVARYCSVTLR